MSDIMVARDVDAEIRRAVRRELVAAKYRGDLPTSRQMIAHVTMRGIGEREPQYLVAQTVRAALTDIAAMRSYLGRFAEAVRRAHLRVVN